MSSDRSADYGGPCQCAGDGSYGGQDGLHQGLAVTPRVWHHLLPHPHVQHEERGEQVLVSHCWDCDSDCLTVLSVMVID